VDWAPARMRVGVVEGRAIGRAANSLSAAANLRNPSTVLVSDCPHHRSTTIATICNKLSDLEFLMPFLHETTLLRDIPPRHLVLDHGALQLSRLTPSRNRVFPKSWYRASDFPTSKVLNLQTFSHHKHLDNNASSHARLAARPPWSSFTCGVSWLHAHDSGKSLPPARLPWTHMMIQSLLLSTSYSTLKTLRFRVPLAGRLLLASTFV
jgi:hypothetical protein